MGKYTTGRIPCYRVGRLPCTTVELRPQERSAFEQEGGRVDYSVPIYKNGKACGSRTMDMTEFGKICGMERVFLDETGFDWGKDPVLGLPLKK